MDIFPARRKRFDINHPFWKTAVELRQNQEKITTIFDKAKEAGYDDIRYQDLVDGFKTAPRDLHLPLYTAKALQHRYRELTSDFDSLETMKSMVQEGQRRIIELEEELENPDITPSRKMYAENQHSRWCERVFEWAHKCSELQVKIRGYDYVASAVDSAGEVTNRPDPDYFRKLAEDIRQKLAPPSPEKLAEMYGSSNVRPANSLEITVNAEEDD